MFLSSFNFFSIGVVAGDGDLPLLVLQRFIQYIDSCLSNISYPSSFSPSICIVQLCPNSNLEQWIKTYNYPIISIHHKTCSWAAIGEMMSFFSAHFIKNIVLAGGVKRPSLKELAILSVSMDFLSKKWFQHLAKAFLTGDNNLLDQVRLLIEQEGFFLHSARSFLPHHPLPLGYLTKISPTEKEKKDIIKGIDIIETLSPLDIGQAVIIEDGLVLGIEAVEGTAHLIERCGHWKEKRESILNNPRVKNGVLIKGCKKNQLEKIDLPTMGPDTIMQLAFNHFAGVAFDYRGQILYLEKTLSLANEQGLFIFIYDADKKDKDEKD
jgi:DUF1009 family protein